MRLSTGLIVNERYRIARLLAQGGMGAVYRAWDLALNRPVALKEMLPDPNLARDQLAELRHQFMREAQALAHLSHPNLPRVTDFFEWNGNDYLVMDFVEGVSLDSLIRNHGPLPESQVRQWAIQLLDALNICHQRNILHRDIKPQNIIISPDGRANLVDFGLVKLWDPRHPGTQRIIQGMGTQAYASPEHFKLRKDEHTEPRSDVYSLGATLYHALSGQEPPSAIERFSGIPLSLPPVQGQSTLVQALMRSLSLDLNARFTSAYDMLQTLQTGPILPSRHADPPLPRRNAPRRPVQRWVLELGTAMAMAVVCALVTQGGVWGFDVRARAVIGVSLGALIAGAIGWFVGDTVHQVMAPAPPPSATTQVPQTSRPTTRLVVSTRKLVRVLTPAQQIGLLAALLVVAVMAAWILGPLVYRVTFIWVNFPSYAIAGPLAFAALGRRPGRAFMANALVVIVGGLALSASVGLGPRMPTLVLTAAIGGGLMEGIGALANAYLLKQPDLGFYPG
jgi:eukaryotic-like serine/threonine-protein kinase